MIPRGPPLSVSNRQPVAADLLTGEFPQCGLNKGQTIISYFIVSNDPQHFSNCIYNTPLTKLLLKPSLKQKKQMRSNGRINRRWYEDRSDSGPVVTQCDHHTSSRKKRQTYGVIFYFTSAKMSISVLMSINDKSHCVTLSNIK